MAPLGLYLHVPFCARKCPYCDFNTYAGLDDLFETYVDALCREIDRWAPRLRGRTVTTIFLGGGTPTVLEVGQIERILATVQRAFAVDPAAEITSEANPGTVDRDRFEGLRGLGVNRLSMGVQSFQSDELRFLGRIHDVADVYRAFEAARAAGFDNINLDFMFGLPDQSAAIWSRTLDAALALGPEHLSLYSLIVEPDTPLFQWVRAGQVAVPDDDAAAELYELAIDRLAGAGYAQYEVSNWARDSRSERHADAAMPALASRHNLIYWRNQDYLGVGPGAHSHLRGIAAPADGGTPGGIGELGVTAPLGDAASIDVAAASAIDDAASIPAVDRRWANLRPVPGYIRRLAEGRSIEAFHEDIDPATAMGETMMLGLRLVDEGVAFNRFAALHGRDLREVFAEPLRDLADWGLVDVADDRVRLTPRGLMVGNQVFERFMP